MKGLAPLSPLLHGDDLMRGGENHPDGSSLVEKSFGIKAVLLNCRDATQPGLRREHLTSDSSCTVILYPLRRFIYRHIWMKSALLGASTHRNKLE